MKNNFGISPFAIEYSGCFDGRVAAGTTFLRTGMADSNYAFHSSNKPEILAAAAANRKRLLEYYGFSCLITLKQTHSTQVRVIDDSNLESFASDPYVEGDALVTSLEGVFLGILTADCVPVVVFDPASGVLGTAHAGWRGVYEGIVPAAIEKMCELGTRDRGDLRIVIGPNIRQCCYEVSDELASKFAERFGGSCIAGTAGKPRLSLETALRTALLRSGVREENISAAGYCTKCSTDPKFFSYRKGDDEGRLLTYAGIVRRK